MAEIAQEHKDQLKRIKKNIERSFVYFKPNIERYHKFQKFAFQTAISPEEEDTLKAMGKPVIEFNITNAPISRLCGEFSKQEPSIYVSAEEGSQIDVQTMEVVEGHLRHILFESKKHNTQYSVYRDQLSGGFSNFKVWTEYANEMSFDQVIRFGRTFEPTLTGFDPMAREQDKSDGAFCFEIFPMPKEDFKQEYPKIDIDQVQFLKTETGFNWSYADKDHDVIVVVDYYEKKKVRKRIVQIANGIGAPPDLLNEWKQAGFVPGSVMMKDEYDKLVQAWNENFHSAQPPAIMGKPRWTQMCLICRYRTMETEIIDYVETSFKYLPLIFVDGDSIILKNGESASLQQFTKPYIYHAEGIQKMTNFSGQVIANDFENMVMHKFKVAEESLPTEEEFRSSYYNYQLPNTMVYKHLWNENPDVVLPPPMEIARVPLPPEVVNTFNTSMQMLQNILGSYDASLGINDNQLSGVAIVEAATQSNAAAMPYIVNYMQSLNQVANIIVDLIPKFYKTPRTIPIVAKDGKKTYAKINQPGGVTFNYDENALQVKVEAGVNFQVAKNKALQQIIALMQASPLFAQFINTEGLDILLDNMEFRGVDIIKSKAEEFMQKLQQAQAQAQNQPNPETMKAQLMGKQIQLKEQELNQKGEQVKAQTMIDTEKVVNEKAKIENDRLQIMQKAGDSRVHLLGTLARSAAEEERARADMHMKAIQMGHDNAHAAVKLKNEMEKSDKENGNG